MKCLRRLIVLCMPLFLLAGCNGTSPVGADHGDITVMFIPKITGNAFFESANAGAQNFAEQQGFTVQYVGSSQATVENQIEIIESAIEQKVDAICVSSLDATALDDVLKRAMSSGIKVTTWDSDVSGDARMLMISQGTPEQLGQMLVEMGAKSLLARGKDPNTEKIEYAWHYSQASVADQNSWYLAGEKYIESTYPNWKNVAQQNFYSGQNVEKALAVGTSILETHPDIDLIICNDSTSLPGQAQAAQNMGLTAEDVTITGFASPNTMRDFCKNGIVARWGLWDCRIQGALGCYMAFYLANDNTLMVGDKVDVPGIGTVEVMPNTVLDPGAYTSSNSGVVLLPSRIEFTENNVDNYDF